MGNDNQKPTANNQSQTGSLPPVPTDDMPPVVMEDTAPPMLTPTDLPLANTQTTTETVPTVELPKTGSGSAAPSDDVVMAPVITTQKKKFAGGKVIATILGLFLLVGGLGAGIILVDQNQNIEEQAGARCVCMNQNGVNAGHGECVNNICVCDGGREVKADRCRDGGTDDTGPALRERCNYLERTYPQCFPISGSTDPVCAYEVTSDCSVFEEPEPTPEPTPPPTTPPSISASCQNVKAYSSTWTLLTNTQLSQLKVGDSVNFCVTGVATGGSFNKAKFTINNVAQAETTTVRPSSTDFCQPYVIPAATTNFSVKAQINHVTLGWK